MKQEVKPKADIPRQHVELRELGQLYCGQSPAVSEVNNEGRGVPYFTGPEQWQRNRLHVQKWTEAPRRTVPEGCIFITVKGAGVGKLFPGTAGAIGRDIYAFKPHENLDPRYVYYALKATVEEVIRKAKGDIPGLSKAHILDHQIVLPDAASQRRIVAIIEELLSDLDNGVESLKTAREQLAVYRQAVLKRALQGALTARWRKKYKDKLESRDQILARVAREREAFCQRELQEWDVACQEWEAAHRAGPKPTKPARPVQSQDFDQSELSALPRLPSEWSYVRLSDIARIGSGMSVSKNRKIDRPIEVPYLRVANVQRGRLDLADITTMQIERSHLSRLALKQWDVLFNEGGDRDKLGRGWIWESQIASCITQNHVFRASPYLPSEVHAKFISHWGNTFGQGYFDKTGKQTTNLASINKTVLGNFPVPLVPFEEQAEILRQLDEQITVLDRLEAEIIAGLRRSEVLRQSILQKGIAGQLVAQDESDDPTSVCPERITAGHEEPDIRKNRSRKDAA